MAQDSSLFRERGRESGRLLWLAMRLTWRASRWLAVGILLLSVVQAFLPILQLALTKAVIDRISIDLGYAGPVGAFATEFPLAVWISIAVGVLAANQLMEPTATALQTMAGDRLTGYVTQQLIAATNRWEGLQRFEDPALADDLQRVRRYAARSGVELMINGVPALIMPVAIIGLSLTLAALHPLAAPLILLAAVPQMLQEREYHSRTMGHLYGQTPDARRLDYSREVLLTPEPAKDVRLYALGPFFQQRYDSIFQHVTGTLNHLRLRLGKRVALASALATLASGSVYGYVVWMIAHGKLSLGDLALYGGAAMTLQTNLLLLGENLMFLPGALTFLPSLFRVLEAPPDLPVVKRPRGIPQPLKHGIVFEDVEFVYPGTSHLVLRGVSLAIRPSETLALVGLNGAGKTTLVKLLLRLYDPTAGRILLDGVDLRRYDLTELRSEVAAIFQDFVRYELSAGENIGMGNVDTMDDPALLMAAATKAGAGELIRQLPQGLDTQLGRSFGGRELSGGEWQKLALARAFMRDCQLQVLDEPTAALDVQTEYDVHLHFNELTRSRMTLLISHRFSTVRMADRIAYLSGGRVVEEGSHADLMVRGGEYARLYRLQAERYDLADTEGLDG